MGDQSRSTGTSRNEEMRERLETVEQRIELLENTLKGALRESGDVSLSGPCKQCGQCLLVLDGRTLYCPKCGDGRQV